MRHFLTLFMRNFQGATAIEYALIACGIALAIVAAIFAFGDSLQALYAGMTPAAQAISDNIVTGR